MSTPSRIYVGSLVQKDNPTLNLAVFTVEGAKDNESAIDQLTRLAQGQMEHLGIGAATLLIAADGNGVHAIELENPKYAQRPAL